MIRFRPLEESDLPQVEAWLRAEHVAEWWRDPLEIAVEKRREALEGRREVEHYVILEDERPRRDDPDLPRRRPPGVGRADRSGARGGRAWISSSASPMRSAAGSAPRSCASSLARVVFSDPETTAAVATVEEANRRSWRAFEQAGFRHVRDVEEDGLPHRLMRLERRYAQ